MEHYTALVNTRQAVNSQAADLADGAAAELLGELVLGELQRQVDQQQQQLRHGQRGQEHPRVDVVSPGHKQVMQYFVELSTNFCEVSQCL